MNDPNSYPLPVPTKHTKPFWDACQERRLMMARCARCRHRFMPGAPNCPRCWSEDLQMERVAGGGRIYSFAVYRRTYHPAIPAPYIVALIELDEGPRLVSNIVDCDPGDVVIGAVVDVCFQSEEGFLLPRFRLREHDGTSFRENPDHSAGSEEP